MAQSRYSDPELENYKARFVSLLRDFIGDMSQTYPRNAQLERNRGRLTIAAENARDSVVSITGRYLVYHIEQTIEYKNGLEESESMPPKERKEHEAAILVKFFQSRLFVYDDENAIVIGDDKVAKNMMELFEAMQDDLLKQDFHVMDENTETKMSIRRKAADYLVALTEQYITIGKRDGSIEDDSDDEDE